MTTPQVWPPVTVVMPVRNEADFIARSLGAVLNQDYPPDKLDVLVADGMSDDDTVAIIESLPGAERVRVIPNPERIQSYGLNRMIPLATGEIIVRVDGHTIIAPDYVRQCVLTLQDTGADNVGGAMDPVGISSVGKAIAIAGKSPFAVPSVFHVSQTPQYTDTVYLGAWPRRVFETVGLFNTELPANQDYEFNYRIRANGGKIYFNPAIRSHYYSRQTWAHLWRQYHRYGRGKIQTLKQHPQSLQPRQVVAPLFVLGLVTGPMLGWFSRVFLWLYVSVILLYIVLGSVFALRAAHHHEENMAVWRVLMVFVIMHISWGLGFWREIIRPGKL